MRYLILIPLAFGATWALMAFWNALGVGLSYWDTAPLGFTSVLLFGVMASLMTISVEPAPDGPEPATSRVSAQVRELGRTDDASEIGQGFEAWNVRSASTTVPPTQPLPETSSPASD